MGLLNLHILSVHVINIISVSLANLPSNIKWIIGNVGQFGYYRMNYDTEDLGEHNTAVEN